MNDPMARLISEVGELQHKYEDLAVFISSSEYQELEPTDRNLLVLQLSYMQGYLRILEERCKRAFPGWVPSINARNPSLKDSETERIPLGIK